MTAIENLRAKIKANKVEAAKRVITRWSEPTLEDFAEGVRVLAFDQTLTKTGLVVLDILDDGITPLALTIRDARLIRTVAGEEFLKGGFLETFRKAEVFGDAMDDVMRQAAHSAHVIVHEMPAVQGYRTESSLMAAREIRRAARDHGIEVVMLSRMSVYSTLVGNSTAPKARMTEYVNKMVPGAKQIAESWNQDVHDSVGLALKYLYDLKRANG